MKPTFFPTAGAFLTAGLLLSSSSVLAASTQLNLIPSPQPNLNGSFGNVVYNAASDTFRYEGFTTQFTSFGGSPIPILGTDKYVVEATINNAGVLTGGSVKISANIGSGFELVLSGALETGVAGDAYGHQNPVNGQGVDLFEFLFIIDGGAAADQFGGIGAQGFVGIDVNFKPGDVEFNGEWMNSFYSSIEGNGVADAYVVVPEPSTWALLSVAGVLLLFRLSRRVVPRSAALDGR
ncbi:MAG: PEP-CTERM sorting domain-containing protein [Verrucomicrobiae bacterium]|nr:PEP-CTERM sorting domain-containing protein [Verrucomicrobiae bacterium]